ncbi:hypothetical protein RvY_08206-6 [Ramazzottius varieornatus]|uniref:Uncharacterized protein n=1 Tax=Ramazzottius varieornatus TaxID=947166 RepID=A0A1D1VD78_RAMVA|nr:hypothetical protein RvY_08206-6 [Ramazzottius varieornatus]
MSPATTCRLTTCIGSTTTPRVPTWSFALKVTSWWPPPRRKIRTAASSTLSSGFNVVALGSASRSMWHRRSSTRDRARRPTTLRVVWRVCRPWWRVSTRNSTGSRGPWSPANQQMV